MYHKGEAVNSGVEETREERLREAISASRAVAAGMLYAHSAHDMGNRLNRCLMFCHRLLEDRSHRLNPHQHSELKGLQNEIESILRDVRNTLDLFRSRSEGPVPLAINREIPRIVDIWHVVLSRRECAVQVDLLAADSDTVLIPRHDFQELLSALLLNAVEADAKRVVVRTESCEDGRVQGASIGRAVRVSVTDDGHGIPAGDVERLFAASFTTKSDRPGLGLFVARSLARQAGGDLRCDALPDGRGAAFTAVLPVRRQP
jgi:two-component system sensor histidine kinase HydH